MMTAAVTALCALLFGAAAFAGTLLAQLLCGGRVPYDDGPAPVAFRRRAFALAGACAGSAVALHGVSAPHVALLLIVVMALAGCAAADFACGMLPNVLTLGPLALIVAVALAAHDLVPAFSAVFIAAPFAAAAVFSRGRGMGWGDVKLAALGGAVLGARDATLALTVAALVAYIVARRAGAARRPVAFGPYLAASIVAMLAVVRTN
ncbi:MAG: prepilin peptidase [Candidatus Velthaea sp.]